MAEPNSPCPVLATAAWDTRDSRTPVGTRSCKGPRRPPSPPARAEPGLLQWAGSRKVLPIASDPGRRRLRPRQGSTGPRDTEAEHGVKGWRRYQMDGHGASQTLTHRRGKMAEREWDGQAHGIMGSRSAIARLHGHTPKKKKKPSKPCK